MTKRALRRSLLFLLSILACVVLMFGFGGRPAPEAQPPNAFSLQAPPFLEVVYAEEAAPLALPASLFDGEAGIAAYFQSPGPISIASVIPLYRTIEAQTAQYVIGSMPVPGFGEDHDAHVYIHATGWAMAYYLKADPVSKIFDWRQYNGGTAVPTKLEHVLKLVVAQIGISQPQMTFYHFQYPNSTNMLLIADRVVGVPGTDSFQANPTSSFVYDERSWSLDVSNTAGRYYLDDVLIKGSTTGWVSETYQGSLTATQLPADVFHSVRIEGPNCCDSSSTVDGGLAFVYRVP